MKFGCKIELLFKTRIKITFLVWFKVEIDEKYSDTIVIVLTIQAKKSKWPAIHSEGSKHPLSLITAAACSDERWRRSLNCRSVLAVATISLSPVTLALLEISCVKFILVHISELAHWKNQWVQGLLSFYPQCFICFN